MHEQLSTLGLTAQEQKVYLALLHGGPSLAGEITRKTGIHRRNIYDCLERLIKKGLVAYIKENNRKVYAVTDPALILAQLQQQEQEWRTLLPAMQLAYKTATRRHETLFFRGKEGIKLVLEDQITCGKEILVNATAVSVTNVLKFFFPRYQQQRKERKIPTRMIFDASYQTEENEKKIAGLPLCSARFIRDFNKSPMSQYIYGDNVAIVVWSAEPIAILIRQPDVAKGFRGSFEVLWKSAK